MIGSEIIPDSERFTLSTSAACAAIGMFLCTIPMPPFCATVIAVSCSVTVSIAAESSGMLSVISRVRRVRTSTCSGSTSLAPGTSSTSSKVRPSRRSRSRDVGSLSGWAMPEIKGAARSGQGNSRASSSRSAAGAWSGCSGETANAWRSSNRPSFSHSAPTLRLLFSSSSTWKQRARGSAPT